MRYAGNQHSFHFPNSRPRIPGSITAGDCLAGGGGITRALNSIPHVDVRWFLNHDEVAVKTNSFHHPNAKPYHANFFLQPEADLEPVDLLCAGIECTQHSNANGGRIKKIGSYMMGWELLRYIPRLKPLVIFIENVPQFKKWSPLLEDGTPDKTKIGEEFRKWKNAIMNLGYEYKESIRNAADDGIPQRRVRYFAFFYRKGIDISFPLLSHTEKPEKGMKQWESCGQHINLDYHGESIFGRQFNENLPKHKKPTMRRNIWEISFNIN